MLLTTWSILCDSAVFILVGFLLAGVLEVVLSGENAVRLLSGTGVRSVFLATLIGMPLPLCSCSVLPTAVTLRRKGASRGATVSFLISTPETSVTSILLTYALLGPFLAVFRPIAACITALTAGLIEHARERGTPVAVPTAAGEVGTSGDVDQEASTCAHSSHCCQADPAESQVDPVRAGWLRRILRYAFVDLFDDIFGWMIVGIVAAAAIQAWLPHEVLAGILGGPLQSSLMMILIGVPLYICAEASTPVAAALVAHGVDPGAALVLLLVGPATNIGSLGLLSRELGGRTVAVYLLTIIVVALLMGAILNVLVAGRGLIPSVGAMHEHMVPGWLQTAGAVLFLALGAGAIFRNRYVSRLVGWLRALPV